MHLATVHRELGVERRVTVAGGEVDGIGCCQVDGSSAARRFHIFAGVHRGSRPIFHRAVIWKSTAKKLTDSEHEFQGDIQIQIKNHANEMTSGREKG